ncbi:RDD family protein [Flammeovirga sp. SubArs3]|uniref:RDD family protein n=1 Tax=Flammeovirga sp. SubArs3 TaxID=2995316 RepID=UPI00248C8B7C|nr:RDD family protein [Flammeovirga sp. SubArs3]
MSIFYSRFKDKPNDELHSIIRHKSRYQEEAIFAAIKILKERGEAITEEEQLLLELKERQQNKINSETTTSFTPKRVLAFAIDLLILTICSYIIGGILLFTSQTGAVTSLVISAILIIGYFTIGNSAVTKGSTYGKQNMGLHVIDEAQNTLSIGKSFMRSLLILGPYFCIKFLELIDIENEFILVIIDSLSFSYYLSFPFLFFYNKKYRVLYHDLIMKTRVTPCNVNSSNYFHQNNSLKYLGCVPVFFLSLFLSLNYLLEDQPIEIQKNNIDVFHNNEEVFSSLMTEINSIDEIEEVENVSFTTYNQTSTSFIITVKSTVKVNDDETQKVAQIIEAKIKERNIKDLIPYDNIVIVSKYGFTLPLASYTIERQDVF